MQSRGCPSNISFSYTTTNTSASALTGLSDKPKEQPSSSAPSLTSSTDLPDPELAYAQTYHFTTCPHTSPPVSRPLNVQPILAEYHDDLLAYPPLYLRVSPAKEPLTRVPNNYIYIIQGSCGHCDSAARREAESAILDEYADNIDELTERLSLLKQDIESASSQPPESGHESTASASASVVDTAPSTCIVGLNIRLSRSHIRSIVEMENQLKSMIRRRDRKVKAVWKGYTARWGPATLAKKSTRGKDECEDNDNGNGHRKQQHDKKRKLY
ncbi:hypothetical protein A1O3_07501 [Capronia epimyces CBS 606.96]|uniref:Uncharacterized protein n=1 Tax=Capronia epimyces CBS 606.96 TaxID=1182542 RepID=W9XW33_9EURO|nr:uncharacterized protein A1O3_07501 [Capronia epimyces CBS 606.96]EXJ81211.1 hypothetical protein A1O3_07501 [Capronia epimyces CBS 606.96]